MSGEFDKSDYELEQMDRFRQAAAVLRAMPAFRQRKDSWGRGPAVELQCPKLHKLLNIYVDDSVDRMTILPVAEQVARVSGAVTTVAEPWNSSRFRVCLKPGCPALIDYVGTCAQHGGDKLEVIGGVRTEFTCRQCKKVVGTVTTTRLLQLYGVAVHLGTMAIPIGDTR